MTERDMLLDCLNRLNGCGVSYMLTGPMASNYWGIPRTTHDIDVVLQLPPPSIRPLLSAFSGDFYIEEDAVRAACRPPHQFNAIDRRSALKVDFWLLRDSPFEREMFSRRLREGILGVQAWIATPEDVILHKLLWNARSPSERQLGDAAGVAAVQRDGLDRLYLRRWATELQVLEALEDILAGRVHPKTT
jgi:hypothetical protein